MRCEVTGKIALVTGASRGIGKGIAIKLAEAGATVVINYLRRATQAENLVAEIEKRGGRARAIRANVTNDKELDEMFQVINEEYGCLDILVSNAASGVFRPGTELSRRHWQWTMEINAGSLLPLVQRAIPLMRAHGGHVVAVSSHGAVRAIPYYTAIGASKAALEAVVRHLAAELAPQNIHVNAVSSGVVDTDALKHFPNREELLKESLRRTPAGRLTTPEDVADCVLFLVSPLSKMIHGQTLTVDGGHMILA
ncbi:MAG: enoyl-[acyl-carrier-protein] reductase FabL [Candidatus Eisenbacteria bacterium]|uniref:Enoyl-[acyl-carrier-protein] reductase [NADH] n=1 Tax=Eiseniibacteriota bacterium TaxID=2212470 RepID=A0A948RVL2_UNCEI|nr:enoyl-[acyl-carrier-protein] reductase FabL [Candidatus Eisenbacteria bacterium]MBU1947226.1 enoyl-[acyl-carrier-protein] reductase FabL [Candidatus Eisenbacteria bacterium]MBU2690509.1 enoyl-[acyl-carrier-protein] reductase FabL [Candidatus Eisenbacteria bacterium]